MKRKKEPIKVSVLIPAYNVERYIDQCLESVMNQTLREIEIIVVDDCSTDSTLAHIEAAAEKDSRIRVIRHEKNRKQMQSRKDAVLDSRGEYVMFLDEIDDYYAGALEGLARERDRERGAWEAERESLKAERSFWETELYATRKSVSFRVGQMITWLPRKLRGGIRCYREHGGKYTFYRLLYHLRLAPNNDGSGF